MRISLSLALRLAQYTVVAVALGVVTWVQLNSLAHPNPWITWTCAIVIGTGGVIDGAVRALMDEVGQLSFQKRILVEQALLALLDALDQAGLISLRDIGATAFLTRRTRRHPFRGVQLRVARMRLTATPHPTLIQWTWRKGLLGECWEHRKTVGRNHGAFYGPHVGLTKRQWKKVDPAIRQRLTYRDLQSIRDFGYVEAHPCIDPSTGNYRGCLVVQVAVSKQSDIQRPEARALVDKAAATVAALAS